MLRYNNHQRNGFTLIELLVVVAIISALMGILIPAVNYAIKKARIMECSNNLHQLFIFLERYKDTNGAYPKPGSPDFWNSLRGLPGTNPIVSDNRLFYCKLAGIEPEMKNIAHLDYTYPMGENVTESSEALRVLARDKVKNHGTMDCINVLFYQGTVETFYKNKAEYADIIAGKEPFGPQGGDDGK